MPEKFAMSSRLMGSVIVVAQYPGRLWGTTGSNKNDATRRVARVYLEHAPNLRHGHGRDCGGMVPAFDNHLVMAIPREPVSTHRSLYVTQPIFKPRCERRKFVWHTPHDPLPVCIDQALG